jgi:polar amino acid transport system substrate-binding protein
MKKRKIIIAAVLAFTLFLPATSFAGEVLNRIIEKGELVVGVSGDQPPLHARTSTGEIIGLDIDISRVMANAMGVKLKIAKMSFPELLPALEAGTIDMILSGMTITPERNLKVAFIGPYFVTGKGILGKSQMISSLKSSNDINSPSFKLAALKNSTGQSFAENVLPKAKLTTTDSLDDALDLLIQGEVDAVVADYPFCAVSALRYREKGLATLQTPFNYEPMGIALPGDDPLLINWVQNFLNTLKGSGDLKKLTGLWFNNTSWLDKLPSKKEFVMLLHK